MNKYFARLKGPRFSEDCALFPWCYLGYKVPGPCCVCSAMLVGMAVWSVRSIWVLETANLHYSLNSRENFDKNDVVKKSKLETVFSDFKMSPKIFQCIRGKFRLEGLLLSVSWTPLLSSCLRWGSLTEMKLCRSVELWKSHRTEGVNAP